MKLDVTSAPGWCEKLVAADIEDPVESRDSFQRDVEKCIRSFPPKNGVRTGLAGESRTL